MYLFDTDIVTNIHKKRPSPDLLHRLARVAPDEQHISVITVAEIVFGAQKSPRPEYHLQNLQALLSQIAVLDFDLKAAYLAGKIRAALERSGTRLAWADIQIASIALSNDLMLITGDLRHFSRISSLRVANWL